tara:strand:- start:167 stop:559 length:393 start_codon:yes stop_codon:yes gene_type:complete
MDEASKALDLPSGDALLARAVCLPRVEIDNATGAQAVVERAIGLIPEQAIDPLSTEDWPRVADLLAQWLRVMGVNPAMMEGLDSQEPTSSDSGLISGTATRTDWVETDLSRADLTSSTHEGSQITGTHDG